MAVSVPNVATGRFMGQGGAVGTSLTVSGSGDRIVVAGASRSGSGTAVATVDGVPCTGIATESTGRRSALLEYRGPRLAFFASPVALTFWDPGGDRKFVGGFELDDTQDSPCTVTDTDASASAGTALATSVTVPSSGGLIGVACVGANGTVVTASGATAAAAVQNAQLSSTCGYEVGISGSQAMDWTTASGARSCVTGALGPRAQSLSSLAPAVDATGVSPSIGTIVATMAAAAVLGSAGNVRIYETVAPSVSPSVIAESNGVATGTTTPTIATPGQATAWVPSTAYTAGDVRRNTDRIYLCTGTGLSAGSGGPTGTGTGIADNLATWDYVSEALLAGDWIVWSATHNADGLVIPIAGWNAANRAETNAVSCTVLTRKCTGSEGNTLGFTLGAANDIAWHAWLVRGVHATDYPYLRFTSGTTANADPPSVELPYSEPGLVLAYLAMDTASTTITDFPSGHTGTGQDPTTNGTASARVTQAYSRSTYSASSIDPGAFTHAARNFVVATIALRPADPSTLVETVAYSACSVSGNDLEIPIGTLSASTAHHVQLDDQVAVGWYGFDASQREWRFTTGAGGAGHDDLTGLDLVGSAPALTAGTLSQHHALTSGPLTTPAPTLTTGALSQHHALSGVDLVTGAPTLSPGSLAGHVDLTGDSIATGAPTLTAGALTQMHVLAGLGITTPAPMITAGTLSQHHALISEPLLVGVPFLTAGSLGAESDPDSLAFLSSADRPQPIAFVSSTTRDQPVVLVSIGE